MHVVYKETDRTFQRHIGKVGHGTRKVYKRDAGTRDPGLPNVQVGPGTRDHEIFMWYPGPGTRDPLSGSRDPGPGTQKYLSGIHDSQFSIVLTVYSTLNTLHFTCYKTLH